MKIFKSILFVVIITAMLMACAPEQTAETPEPIRAEVAFFNEMAERCGSVYYGESVYPDDPEHVLYGAALKMTIASCTETEIRIPFQADENTSRTWVLTLSDEGLLFKHDHRHEDGTPEDLTNYGGWAREGGSATKMEFPADDETAEMLPEAVTNVWSFEIDEVNGQFIYYLERHDLPRYKAVFSLN